MRLPRRSLRTIQPLPSILTTFPENGERNGTSPTPIEDSPGHIEAGLEIVPLERSNTQSAKIISPGHEEKEVVAYSAVISGNSDKPLPELPVSCLPKRKRIKKRWHQLSGEQRICVVVGIVFIVFLAVGLSLMAIKGHKTPEDTKMPQQETPLPTIALRRGTFALSLGQSQQQSSACLLRSNESIAWSCPDNAMLQVGILPSPDDDIAYPLVTFSSLLESKQSVYGQQPFTPPNIQLTALNGTTYHFRATYNTTMLLSATSFGPTATSSNQTQIEGTLVRPGDQLWLCFFNNTQSEGYIYLDQESIYANQSTVPYRENITASFPAAFFPYVLKLTEKRLANSTLPYCEQRQALQNGDPFPSNKPDRIYLLPSQSPFTLGAQGNDTVEEEKSCQCHWTVQ